METNFNKLLPSEFFFLFFIVTLDKSRVLGDIWDDRLTNAKRNIEKYGIRTFEFYPPILVSTVGIISPQLEMQAM